MISEVKNSEQRKQEEEAHFEKLFEKSPEAIVYLNSDGKIQRINKAFTIIFGFENSEVINKSLDELKEETNVLHVLLFWKIMLHK